MCDKRLTTAVRGGKNQGKEGGVGGKECGEEGKDILRDKATAA
jgi:hypothetical protein